MEFVDPTNSRWDFALEPRIRETETVMSRVERGCFLGRTARRGEGVLVVVEDVLEGDVGRVGLRVDKDTRDVLPFRLLPFVVDVGELVEDN